jgi:hypothetical protein
VKAGLFEMGEDQFGYRVCGGKGPQIARGLCSIAFTAFTEWRRSAWAMAGWNCGSVRDVGWGWMARGPRSAESASHWRREIVMEGRYLQPQWKASRNGTGSRVDLSGAVCATVVHAPVRRGAAIMGSRGLLPAACGIPGHPLDHHDKHKETEI